MIAPASLKLAHSEAFLPCLFPTTPGHDCPGLIEAVPRRMALAPLVATPGHDCPGLIEARGDPVRGARAGRPLRGMIAPASLKPQVRGRWAAAGRRPLRGMIAPASLKPRGWRASARWPITPLRGMIAPASLKHLRAPAICLGAGHPTPGHDCPGLIEATRAHSIPYGDRACHSGA